MYVFVGKLNWPTYAQSECITIVIPTGFALKDPVCAYWQWTVDTKGNKNAQFPQLGTITSAEKTSNAQSLGFTFGYYSFNGSVTLNFTRLSLTMSNLHGDTSDLTLSNQINDPSHALTASVFIGKLNWFEYSKDEMATLVIPVKAGGQPVVLNHQWTQDGAGEKKVNHAIVSTLISDSTNSDNIFRARFSAGYYTFHLEISNTGDELMLTMMNPHNDRDPNAPYRLKRADFGKLATKGIDHVSMISRSMVVDEVIYHLNRHGCEDITDQLSLHMVDYPIAYGGYSDVYKSILMPSQELVALKVARSASPDDSKILMRSARELRAWSKCNHPNVVKLLGVAKFRNRIAIVSPWMAYGTLQSFVSQRPEADRYELSIQICDGLAYLHGKSLVHGDLKGNNVLVSDEGVTALTDFGNATLKDPTLRFTETTTKPGLSLQWAAPELLVGSGEIGTKADVYALGMTVLEAFTGQVPYPEYSFNLMYRSALENRPQLPKRPSAMPPDNERGDKLWDLLKNCWAIDPEGRPTSVQVLERRSGKGDPALRFGGSNMGGPHRSSGQGSFYTVRLNVNLRIAFVEQ